MSKPDRQRRWRERKFASRELVGGRMVATRAREHGVPSTYQNWGCRCEPCTTANTDANGHAARFASRREINGRMVATRTTRHGSESTYRAWGCRCEPCTTAAALARTARRRRAS